MPQDTDVFSGYRGAGTDTGGPGDFDWEQRVLIPLFESREAVSRSAEAAPQVPDNVRAGLTIDIVKGFLPWWFWPAVVAAGALWMVRRA